jgi:diacylglycerol kinase family enzyme
MPKKQYVLVINLKSRKSAKALTDIKSTFKKQNASLKVLSVKDPSKGMEAHFQKALDLKPDVIVLGGGDGTLISGIEYLSSKNFSKDIGLLPLGTANYLARNLHIPLTIDGSVKRLLKGNSREIPLGVANGKFFALTFVLGITQAVSEHVSDITKRKYGQIAYIMEFIKQTRHHQPFKYRITSPALKRPLKGTSHQVLVYNSDLNMQLKLLPDHELAKPNLKVVVSRTGKSKTKLYLSFLTHIITLGKLRPFMRVFETEELKITTTPKLAADYDGEISGHSPFTIKMCDSKIRIIC